MRSRILFAGLVAVALSAGSVLAEPIGSHFEITPIGGFTIFDGDFRYPGTTPLTDDLFAGIRFGWQYNPWLGLEGAFDYIPSAEDANGGADVNVWHGSANLMLTPWATRWGGPYVFGGFGNGQAKADGADELKMGLLEVGGGVRLWMTDALGVRLEGRALNWVRDESSKEGATHIMVGGGVTFALGGTPRDTDGDGVPDRKDKCPDTPRGATVDANGCPIEIVEKETELLDTGMIRLQDVNFETAKADILPTSYATLDVVGQLLKNWPELRIEIGGHTDSRGSGAANQKLSEARANSVKTYLLTKFPDLKAEQFTAKGYGESQPIAPNSSPENMAKNRRVEFKVLNRDVLRRESERRRLLQQGGAPADTTQR